MKYFLSIDIGASSGRHIIGYIENDSLVCEEIYRFGNYILEEDHRLIWDIDRLFEEVKKGIRACLNKYPHIESMAIDTWGVDYVLMNGEREILPCYAYRDDRTKEIIDEVHSKISFDRLYRITGSQFQTFNTIYQLYWDQKHNRLNEATDFLMIPEYLSYRLTGVKKKEYTNASTTGFTDASTTDFSEEIIDALHFPHRLFPSLNHPGTKIGDFSDEIASEIGGNIPVVFCSSHDTASAVEGIEIQNNVPYISSGTWSLLGIKIDKAITSPDAQKANYSNEYGPNYIRFQKNIMGLWIIQCLSKEMNLSFEEMVKLAKRSEYTSLFDVNDERFKSPKNMMEEIRSYFSEKKIVPPDRFEDYINSVFHSLSESYRCSLEELETITGRNYQEIYICGGGAKNEYLNKLIERYTEKKIIALPIEATSRGNILSQIKEDYHEKRN